jgi:hypothetical protein
MLIATKSQLIPYHSIASIEAITSYTEDGKPRKVITQITLMSGHTITIATEFPDFVRILGQALNNNIKFLDLDEDEIPF